jgi:hypothetical protein
MSYKQIGKPLIFMRLRLSYRVYTSRGGGGTMNNKSAMWFLRFRQFAADALIATSMLAVGVATVSSPTNAFYVLLIPAILVGIGLVVEPDRTQHRF